MSDRVFKSVRKTIHQVDAPQSIQREPRKPVRSFESILSHTVNEYDPTVVETIYTFSPPVDCLFKNISLYLECEERRSFTVNVSASDSTHIISVPVDNGHNSLADIMLPAKSIIKASLNGPAKNVLLSAVMVHSNA